MERLQKNMFNSLLFLTCASFAVGQTPKNCSECSGETWDSCDGVNHVCRSTEKCVSAVSNHIQVLAGKGQVVTQKVNRRCVDAALCDKDFSANFGFTHWKIKTTCGADAIIGNENLSQGSLKCFGCISTPSECTKTVECTEAETMCISASETVAGNLMVNKGCATSTMCKLRKILSDVVGPVIVGEVSCCQGNLCNGSGILRASTSTVCLLFLLILPQMSYL